MGNAKVSYKINYNIPIKTDNKKENETQIYRCNGFGKKLLTVNDDLTLINYYKITFKKYSDLEFLGEKIKIDSKSIYKFYTYKDIFNKINSLGYYLNRKKLFSNKIKYKNNSLKCIGIFSQNSVNYLISEFACCTQNIVLVNINTSFNNNEIEYIIKLINLKTLFISSENYIKLIEINRKSKLGIENLIIWDSKNFEDKHKLVEQGKIKLIYFEDLIKENIKVEWAQINSNSVYSFIFTSGTTGQIKAAVISHKNIVSFINAIDHKIKFENEIYLSFLPITHSTEKIFINKLLTVGAKIAIFSGDIKSLLDDVKIINPTIFPAVPKLLNELYKNINIKIEQLSSFKKIIFNKIMNSKLKNFISNGNLNNKFYDFLFLKNIKYILGKNLKYIITGSASTNPIVINFLKIWFSVNIYEAYGLTEGCVGEFITNKNNNLNDHVGGVFPNLEFKLVDIPELNYFHTDLDSNNNPSPKGEIWIRGESIFSGYLNNEIETNKVLTEDGWLKTGDIGQILYPENRLKIIDRKKNIFKLSNGEIISPDKIESAYKNHPYIDDIFIYTNFNNSDLIAIVNIELSNLILLCKKFKIKFENDLIILRNNKYFKEAIHGILNEIHELNHFKSYEIIKYFYLEDKSFIELGLLTYTQKLKRNKIKNYYKEKFKEFENKEEKIKLNIIY